MHKPLTTPAFVFDDLYSVWWIGIVDIYIDGFLPACFSDDLPALAGWGLEEYAPGLLQKVMLWKIKTQRKNFKRKIDECLQESSAVQMCHCNYKLSINHPATNKVDTMS